MDFQDQLNAIISDNQPLTAAGLTFLSDLPSAERATLALLWPASSVERRRKIATTLVQVAEDNIEYNFDTALTVLLDDPDAQVRRLAVEGLVEDESTGTLRRLLTVLESDADAGVRAAAAVILAPAALRAETGKVKRELADRLRDSLLQAVHDPAADPEVRRRALEAVGYFGGHAEVEAEIAHAYAESGLLPASAVRAMGRNMNTSWVPMLLKEVKSAQPVMRFEAAQALGELGERANAPALLPLLEDDDPEVQLAAVWALGQLGGRVAQQALQMLGDDLEPALQEAVEEALTEIRHAANPLAP